MESLRVPVPPSVPIHDSVVVVGQSDQAELCVVCDSVGIYTLNHNGMGLWAPGRPQRRDSITAREQYARAPSQSRETGRGHLRSIDQVRPIAQSSYFGEIDGDTLEWWHLSISHTPLIMGVTQPRVAPLALRFNFVTYVDSPTTMHNARLRLATAEDDETLRQHIAMARRLPSLEAPLSQFDGRHVIIECDEGIASILANMMFLSWREEDKSMFDIRINDSLWSGGPPLAEL